MYKPKPYKIIEIKKLIPDVRLFKVKYNLNPKPGQFFEVSIPGIGECPLASCSFNKNFADILVRKVGNVSSALFQLKKSDNIFIRGPYGNGWPIEKLKNKNLVLIAGGTGIAPVTSMIEYIEKNRKKFKKIYIYFAFRNYNYILLKEKIKKWKKLFDLKISLNEKIDGKDEFSCEIGFVQDLIFKEKPELKNSFALICGPEGMMKCVTDKLVFMGMKENEIFWSTERRMECGFGSCGRCQIQDLYVCKDGPIFRYDIIKVRLENEQSSNEVK